MAAVGLCEEPGELLPEARQKRLEGGGVLCQPRLDVRPVAGVELGDVDLAEIVIRGRGDDGAGAQELGPDEAGELGGKAAVAGELRERLGRDPRIQPRWTSWIDGEGLEYKPAADLSEVPVARLDDTRNVLIGRAQECARIERLLDAARDGASGVLLVRGEPGIGKSTLLDAAGGLAAGMTVLRARGSSRSPSSRSPGSTSSSGRCSTRSTRSRSCRRSRSAARRLAPVADIDRFAVYAGTLSLLAAVAERGPLLVLADDAHWLDDASAGAIVFAARRLGAEGILLVAALRDGVSRRS